MKNLARQDKHQLILAKGAQAMTVRGYHGTGVQEIVQAAGVPKGSFYHYFASKEDFALQALDFIYAPRLARYAKALAEPCLAPLERVVRYYQEIIAQLRLRDARAYYCFIGTLSFEMAELSKPIGAKVESILVQSVELLCACLQEAKARGDLACEVDCRALAEFIANAWEGALMRMKVGASVRPLEVFIAQLSALLESKNNPGGNHEQSV